MLLLSPSSRGKLASVDGGDERVNWLRRRWRWGGRERERAESTSKTALQRFGPSDWLEAIRRRSELGRPSMTSMLVPLRASWFSVGFGEERERVGEQREKD